MKYFSMFSGIGGFEYGIQNAYRSAERGEQTNPQGNQGQGLLTKEGQDTSTEDGRISERPTDGADERPLCIGYSEIDKYAIQVYEKHFKHTNYGDATKINPRELPDFDLLVGGFPCQAFSIAGKRKGFDDTRGTLFFDIARILAEKKPRLVVLENVKGLLSHEGGKTFQTIIGVLTDLGYFVEWQVLNSKNFGVPQNRERVFIIGYLGGQPRRKVFPITGQEQQTPATRDVTGTLQAVYFKGDRTGGYVIKTELDFITAGGTKKWNEDGKDLSRNHSQGQRVYGIDGLSTTLSSQGGGWGAKTGLYAMRGRGPNNTQTLEKRKDELTNSITSIQKDNLVGNHSRIRRLTPIECARLQGFPDDWCAELSDTQQYKCYGNAVTTNVITYLFSQLL